ncbi:uncharacterized protein LOC143694084 [Agelaius phoeniceus]|uniref:uncharacterized protein LOC143694084 n=1 Tax=Agelaius phoeniceus TaxID=39638 RepID=UPI00405503DB
MPISGLAGGGVGVGVPRGDAGRSASRCPAALPGAPPPLRARRAPASPAGQPRELPGGASLPPAGSDQQRQHRHQHSISSSSAATTTTILTTTHRTELPPVLASPGSLCSLCALPLGSC